MIHLFERTIDEHQYIGGDLRKTDDRSPKVRCAAVLFRDRGIPSREALNRTGTPCIPKPRRTRRFGRGDSSAKRRSADCHPPVLKMLLPNASSTPCPRKLCGSSRIEVNSPSGANPSVPATSVIDLLRKHLPERRAIFIPRGPPVANWRRRTEKAPPGQIPDVHGSSGPSSSLLFVDWDRQ